MKKLIFTFLFLLQINTASAMTYANEPSNFFGINWGVSASSVQKNQQLKIVSTNKNVTTYTLQTLPKTIYNFDFDSITYSFLNDKLFLVTARKNNFNPSQNPLYKTLVQNHSAPTATRDNLYLKTTTSLWQGFNTTIELIENAKDKTTVLKMYNHKLYLEYQVYNK